jgi:hypothetical protein
VTGTARLAYFEHRVDVGAGVERAAGPAITGEATIHPHARWRVAVALTGGALKGTDGALDRDVGEIGIATGYAATRWMTLEAGLARRVYGTDLARQRWALFRLGGLLRVPFAGNAVHALVGFSWLPVAAVPGLAQPGVAVAATAGLEYRRGRGRLRVQYGLERYDWAAPRRLEQLSALTVSWTLPLGRRMPEADLRP